MTDNKTQPGQKPVKWDRDPVILARLESVAQMMLRRARAWQIAQAMDTSLTTTKRDIRRVRILWQRATLKTVDDARRAGVEQLKLIQQQAWSRYDRVAKATKGEKSEKQADQAGLSWLRLVRECEKDIAELEGTRAPLKVAPTSPGGDKPYGTPARTEDERDSRLDALAAVTIERLLGSGTGGGVGGGASPDVPPMDAAEPEDQGQDDEHDQGVQA